MNKGKFGIPGRSHQTPETYIGVRKYRVCESLLPASEDLLLGQGGGGLKGANIYSSYTHLSAFASYG